MTHAICSIQKDTKEQTSCKRGHRGVINLDNRVGKAAVMVLKHMSEKKFINVNYQVEIYYRKSSVKKI